MAEFRITVVGVVHETHYVQAESEEEALLAHENGLSEFENSEFIYATEDPRVKRLKDQS